MSEQALWMLHVVVSTAAGIIGAVIAVVTTRRVGRLDRIAAMEKAAREVVVSHRLECPWGEAMVKLGNTLRDEMRVELAGVKAETNILVSQERAERSAAHQDVLDLRADVRSIRVMLIEVAMNVKKINGVRNGA